MRKVSPDRKGAALEGGINAAVFDKLQAKIDTGSNGAFVFFGLARNEVLNNHFITPKIRDAHCTREDIRFQISV